MTVATAPRSPLALFRADSEGMNTIPDPRSPSPASTTSNAASSPGSIEHHPDLSNEVATLSTKLINAINHSTDLDDALQEARQQLDAAKSRIVQLEKAAEEHTALISQGLLVKKETADVLRAEAEESRQKRLVAEKERKRMESELETLTATLFEEANTMVAEARKETESANHRATQFQTQLVDTQTLLASQQEQLQDLKAVMHQMSERDETETTLVSSTPSTPGVVHGKMSRMLDIATLVSPSVGEYGEDLQPQHPLFYTQLLTPVLRNDLPFYHDFRALLKTTKAPQTSPVSSRVTSATFSTRALGTGPTAAPQTPPRTPNNAQTASPRESLATSQHSNLPPLKDTRYFKRVLPEDIEPTLRLDLAPHLSWLARRSVLQAIISQSIHIEPLPPPATRNFGPIFACALCGENGKADKYSRRYQFRIQEDQPGERAQRWPLCDWCLGRVRSTCDYVSFLKMCQAGVWRIENSPEREKEAWEEGVRLRERMWWSRVGGGVVPSHVLQNRSTHDEARASDENDRATRAAKEEELLRAKEQDHAKALELVKMRTGGSDRQDVAVPVAADAKRKDSVAGQIRSAVDADNSSNSTNKEAEQPTDPTSLGATPVRSKSKDSTATLNPNDNVTKASEESSASSDVAVVAAAVPGSFDATT